MVNESSESVASSPRPVTVFKKTFESAGLSYTLSDVGPDSSGWPEAVLLRPGRGLWLLDPGADFASWHLLRFDCAGHRLFDCDLVAAAKPAVGEYFTPFAIQLIENDSVLLAVARSLFKRKTVELIEVSNTGEVRRLQELPGALPDNEAILTPAGVLWARIGDATMSELERTLRVYGARGQESLDAGLASSVLAKNLVLLFSGRGVRFVASDGQIREVKLEVTSALEGKLVGGAGAFFGDVRLTQGQPSDDESVPIESKRRLTVLRFDDKDLVVREVLRVTLAPEVFVESARMQFTHFFDSQLWFDATGDFYEVAWHSSSFEVHKYPLSGLLHRK